MKKTPLILMELVIMLLVFSLAAAICLRGFAWADSQSREEKSRDEAWIYLQNAAEILKHSRGDFAQAEETLGGTWDGTRWAVVFENAEKTAVYHLEAVPAPQEEALLGGAALQVTDGNGEILAQVTICWQEVAP